MSLGSDFQGDEYDNHTLAEKVFDQSLVACSMDKSKDRPVSFLKQLDASGKSLQCEDDDVFASALPEEFIGLRAKLALDSGGKNGLTKSVLKILGQ